MYESYFHLRESPFNVTPDPRFFFSNPSVHEALATLASGIEERKGLIVITGEAGTGKTTLIKLFAQNPGRSVHLSCVLDPRLSFLDLLRCGLNGFGLDASRWDRATVFRELKSYLAEQHARDHQVALMLDEAQDIDEGVLEELGLLTDLERNGVPLLQLVLLGQPELQSQLDRAPLQNLRRRVALWGRLMPLGRSSVRSYIDFRLAVSGYRGKPIFQRAAVERIGDFSQGIPRLVNVICDNALVAACATGQREIGAEAIDEVAEDLQLGEAEAASGLEIRAPAPEFLPPCEALPEPDLESQDFDDGQDQLIETEPTLQSPPPSDGAAQDLAPPAPVLLALPTRRRSMAGAVLFGATVLIAGGIGLFFSHPGNVAHWSPMSKPMEKIQRVFVPLPGRIYRVFLARAPSPAPFKSGGEDRRGVDPSARKRAETTAVQRLRGDKNRASANADRKPSHRPVLSVRARRTAGALPAPVSHLPLLSPGDCVVFGNSFVRDRPASKAEIIATLRPGTRVQVVRRRGEYYQIRWRRTEADQGYVHREDAFFRPIS